MFCSLVLEVLYIVNEQVERRTYGAMSLNSVSSGDTSGGTGASSNTNPAAAAVANNNSTSAAYLQTTHTSTISIWENLVRQTRVALLLQSRSGTSGALTR